MKTILVGIAVAVIFPGIVPAGPVAVAEGTGAVRISHISGKPVPRFESLRYNSVNGRAGPSLEHPIRWHYERAGLPVMILKETEGWRYVRDPDGDEVWVHARMLSAAQTALITDATLMRAKPETESRAVARLHKRAQVDILEYDGAFIRVESGRYRGWVDADHVWGQTVGLPAR